MMATVTCRHCGITAPHGGFGYCHACYQRSWRLGHPPVLPPIGRAWLGCRACGRPPRLVRQHARAMCPTCYFAWRHRGCPPLETWRYTPRVYPRRRSWSAREAAWLRAHPALSAVDAALALSRLTGVSRTYMAIARKRRALRQQAIQAARMEVGA